MTTSKKILSEKENLLITFLFLEYEIRNGDMPLTAEALKKVIKTALKEMSLNFYLDTETMIVKKCLHKALNEQDEKIVSAFKQFSWEYKIGNVA